MSEVPDLTLVRDACGEVPDRLDILLEEVRGLVEVLEARRTEDAQAEAEASERRLQLRLIHGGAAADF